MGRLSIEYKKLQNRVKGSKSKQGNQGLFLDRGMGCRIKTLLRTSRSAELTEALINALAELPNAAQLLDLDPRLEKPLNSPHELP